MYVCAYEAGIEGSGGVGKGPLESSPCLRGCDRRTWYQSIHTPGRVVGRRRTPPYVVEMAGRGGTGRGGWEPEAQEAERDAVYSRHVSQYLIFTSRGHMTLASTAV